MSSVPESVSKNWRENGNVWYGKYQHAVEDRHCKLCLESAIKAYYRSYETATNSDEISSAAKNFGMAAWRLANVLHKLNDRPICVEFQIREAIKYFSKATFEGKQCKSSKWIDDLGDSYKCCIITGIECLDGYPYRARVIALESFLNVMCEESQKAECFVEMATVMSQAGCAALGTKDFTTALQAFHDCYRPVQECFRLSKGCGDIFKEASVIDLDVIFHMATAEAMQAIKIGDDTLKLAVESDDTINMSMVYDAMDLYKRAVVATREVEVEMEAIAVSRLGSLFDKVLKIKSKAREYFNLCIQLATSLHPRTFNTEPWYKTCAETLQRYQSEAVHNDEPARQAERDKCLKELEKELKDIKGADVGSGLSSMAGLLRHVYKTYPPKNADHKLNEEGLSESKNMKKTLLTAIQHYHPDKQDKEAFGLKWVVLCEEITKMFNCRYECYKFPADD